MTNPGQNHRSDAQYDPFRMEYDTSHPRGHFLVGSEDVHPRHIFYSDRAAGIRIDDADPMVTAYTIVNENEQVYHWIRILRNPSKKAEIQADPQGVLSWPAQTTIASSYGLMQVLFENAFTYDWIGIGGRRRPYYLFDIASHRNTGASLQVGSAHFVVKFIHVSSGIWSATVPLPLHLLSPTFDSATHFDDTLKRAFSHYNGSYSTRTKVISKYGKETFTYSQDYQPTPTKTIF